MPYICLIHGICFSLSDLTSLCMTDSRFSHITANDLNVNCYFLLQQLSFKALKNTSLSFSFFFFYLRYFIKSLRNHIIMAIDGMGFPGGSYHKESACDAGDLDLIPGSGRSPREGNGHPLQYSCLENPMDRGSW